MASEYHVICLQESLLLPTSHINIPGFVNIRFDSTSPHIRGLCILVRNDFNLSELDCSDFLHNSFEAIGVKLFCSLDAPIHLFNVYRHPNSQTPYTLLNGFFAFAFSSKYHLIVSDFNAHHPAWGDSRQDTLGEHLIRICDDYCLTILNDGSYTFSSPSYRGNSVIDLTIAASQLAPLCSTSTELDPRGSDHMPICTVIQGTKPSSYRLAYKVNLSKVQLAQFHYGLLHAVDKFRDALAPPSLNPLQRYNVFCSLLKETLTSVTSIRPYPF